MPQQTPLVFGCRGPWGSLLLSTGGTSLPCRRCWSRLGKRRVQAQSRRGSAGRTSAAFMGAVGGICIPTLVNLQVPNTRRAVRSGTRLCAAP